MREKDVRLSKIGFKYVPARLVESKKKWYLTYWVWDLTKGKLIEKKFYKIPGKTLREKRAAAREIKRDLDTLLEDGYTIGEATKVTSQKAPTLLEALEQAVKIKSQETGTRSQQAYRSFFTIFKIWMFDKKLQNIPITSFSRSHVLEFLDWLLRERQVKPKTRNNYKICLNACLNALVNREIIEKNPCARIKDLKVVGTRHIPFSREEQKEFETFLQRQEPELYLYTRFIYFGFMRPVEVCRMQIGHIDLQSKVILIRAENSKNKRQMPVVINPQLAKIIEGMNLNRFPTNYHVFGKKFLPSPGEEHRNRYSERHAQALKDCGLYNGELTLYSWKHTGNIRAYDAGVDIYSLMSQNRHSNLQETENYLRGLGLRISKELKEKEW
ncbi:MAG: tyrosine-type recombinase/integrase [Bacteroidota bacterium]